MAGWFAVGAAACLAVWLALGGERGEGAPGFDAKALLRHLPRVRRALEREGSARVTRACERQMPEFLDILGLGLSAGLRSRCSATAGTASSRGRFGRR